MLAVLGVIPGTPIVWTSLDPTHATLSSPAGGAGVAQNFRGTVRIVAQLLTGPSDTASLTILPTPATIALASGNTQTGFAGSTLPLPVTVLVKATDGLGVSGVPVTFAAANGGVVGAAPVLTDANGNAQTTWKLGATIGAQSLTATASGLTGSPITFTATATAAPATKLAITTQPAATTTVGNTLAAMVVTVQDAGNNTATTFTGPVTVAFGTNTVGAVLGGTTTVNAVAGIATFSTLTVNKVGTGFTLVATSPLLTNAVTNAFATTAGAAARLAFTTSINGSLGGATLTPTITVAAVDTLGNPVISFTDTVRIAIATNPSTGILSGTLKAAAVAGVASFTNLAIDKAGIGYTLSASATGLNSGTSLPFSVAVGPPTTLGLASGGAQSGPISTALPSPIIVKVTDLGGNGVAGRTVTFATANGTLSAASGVTDALGQISIVWTLGATLGAQTMTATSAGLTGSPLTIGATAAGGVAGPATSLVFSTGPTTAVAGASNAPAIVVQGRDALGALATTFTGNVTLAIGANPGTSTLGGTVTFAAVGGIATFPSISLNKTGVGYTLTATSGALPVATSGTFNITPAAATNLGFFAGNGQTGLVLQTLPTPLIVKVTDAFANAVPGVPVSWVIPLASGALVSTTFLTDTAGQAKTSWILGALPGLDSVLATSGSLTGSPLLFTATGVTSTIRTWTGTTSTAWATSTNWSPVGVPVSTDSVVVPFTATLPTLSGVATVKALTLASGAILTISSSTLTVNGTLDATGSIAGSGSVVLASVAASTVKGSLSMPLNITGPYKAIGTLSAGGLQVSGSGAFDINGQTVTVTLGGIASSGSGTIKMTVPGSALTTTGSASFSGGSEVGLLTTGTLTVGGNFIQGGASSGAFSGTINHTTILNGSAARTISMPDGLSSFGSLVINNSSGMSATTNFAAFNLTMTAGTLTSTFGASINGTLTDPSGLLQVAAISFGQSTAPISATTPNITVSAGSITFNNNPSILAGTVTLNTAMAYSLGNLVINGNTLTINGGFTTQGSGQLTMNNAADVMNVTGPVTFGSTSAGGPMSNGTMTVRGDFTQTGSVQSLSTFGSHTIVFTGTAAQIVNFATPDVNYTGACSTSCFQNLTVNKAAGGALFFTSPVKVIGAYSVVGPGPISTLATNGSFIIVGNAILGQNAAYHRMGLASSSYSKSGLTTVDSVSYFGAAQTYNPASLGEVYSDIRGTVNWSAPTTLTGDMVLSGTGQLNVSTSGAIVTGNFTSNGSSTLKMTTNASDSLKVNGNAVFAGGSTDGLLTAGYFIVNGNLDMGNGSLLQYSSTVAHTTVLGGAATQNILINPVTVGKGFNDVLLRGTGNKPLLNAIVYARDVYIGSSVTTGITGFTWQLSGKLTDSSSIALTTGAWRPNATVFTTAPTKLPRRMSGNIAFKAGAVSLLDTLYVGALSGQAQVAVDGASTTLALNGFKLQIDTVVGAFTTQNGGKLIMTSATDTLKASDYFFFGGQSNQLTNGSMFVYGNFTQSTTATAFQAGGSHRTYLKSKGVAGRTVSFANPSATNSYFSNLILVDTVNTTTFSTDVVVNDEIRTIGTLAHAISSSNKLLTSGGADVTNLLFTNTRWLILDGDSITTAQNVQFLGMTPTVTQLQVFRRNVFPTASFNSFVFNTVPTGGGLYLQVFDTDSAANGFLNVNMVSPNPAVSAGLTATVGGATITGWPSVAAASAIATGLWNATSTWSTGVVPTSATNVTIGSGFTVTVSTAQNVNNVVVSAGGSLILNAAQQLNVAGNFTNNGTTTCSNDEIVLGGATATLQGFNICGARITGTVTLTGPTNIQTLTIPDGTLIVNGQNLVTTNLTTLGTGAGGLLKMTNTADSVAVAGNLHIGGVRNTAGLMNAGSLVAYGNIVTDTGFSASGTHKTWMASASGQTITMNPSSSIAGFQDLILETTANTTVIPGQGNYAANVNGRLVARAGSAALVGGTGIIWIHNGAVYDSTAAGDAFRLGSMYVSAVTALPKKLVVPFLDFENALTTLQDSLTVQGLVEVNGPSGVLNLNGHTLRVTLSNAFVTSNGGKLKMLNAADTLDLSGNAVFSGGSETGLLTNGFLRVGGNFTQSGSTLSSFTASGAHKTVFNSGGIQTVTFANPDTSFFQDLELGGSTSTTAALASNILIKGTLSHDASSIGHGFSSTTASTMLVTASGLIGAAYPTNFNNVALMFLDGTANATIQTYNFLGFPTGYTGTAFTVNRTTAPNPLTLTTINFISFTLGTGGKYITNLGTVPLNPSGTGCTISIGPSTGTCP